MAPSSSPDTIRILVASDNHVGYEERDPIRRDDSWITFDEIIQLANTEDADMVLLAGDLFHDNKPSRKAIYQVMRTLRKNCLGMKPCELEFLSDANLVFEGAFPHVNYEDPDINVSIPVFSIHGNHDDPSGDGHLCSLDLLQCAGLINYYGRVSEGDNIEARPILLQKGATRLALYGLSNVRDERMFRTFRDGKVRWFRPDLEQADWFNLLSVHQNHHAHTATSYLPEGVLPDWMDLIVWGHEHECLIDPTRNPETGFHVMQPGSSVATSLVPGEAVRKHVAIVSVEGKNFRTEKIPLRTVRPFVTRELILSQNTRFRGLERKKENRQELTRLLMEVVEEMIREAADEWLAIREGEQEQAGVNSMPLPLVRLKVEYTAPEGGKYDCENPQRFSNRFQGRVANTNDIIYYYRKKTSQTKKAVADMPETIGHLDDSVKVELLVQEFLAAQSLKILPQAPFGDAVTQFVTKDDRLAMETFVTESLAGQVKQMLSLDMDENDLEGAMEQHKARLEAQFSAGLHKTRRRRIIKPQPDEWDSDLEGHWNDQPGVWIWEPEAGTTGPARAIEQYPTQVNQENMPDSMDDGNTTAFPVKKVSTRRPPAKGTKAGRAVTIAKAAPKKASAKGRVRVVAGFVEDSDENDEEEEDVVMDSDDEANAASLPARTRPMRGAAAGHTKQSKLDFSQAGKMAGKGAGRRMAANKGYKGLTISDDEISDDPLEVVSAPAKRR